MTTPYQPQPRWTVEQGPVLVWNDRVLPIPIEWPDGEQAYDALVRAVEDAARLPTVEVTLGNWIAHANQLRDELDDATAPSVEIVQALMESENEVDRLTAERDALLANPTEPA